LSNSPRHSNRSILEVKAGLARVASIDPIKALLDQMDKAPTDRQYPMIGFRLKYLRELGTQRDEWDHTYFEYNPSTELMLIRCMPLAIHEAVPNRLIMQATKELFKLSYTVQKVVEIGTKRIFLLKPGLIWKLIFFFSLVLGDFITPNLNLANREADGFIQWKDRPGSSISRLWRKLGRISYFEDARFGYGARTL
jgi:hypothetical protein